MNANREKRKKLENEIRSMKKKLFNAENNLQNLNNNIKNNSTKNKNVKTWMNASMMAGNKKNIKPVKKT